MVRDTLRCCCRCCLRLPPVELSGSGASLGGSGCDVFRLAACLLDSLKLRAMLTICVESMSNAVELALGESAGGVSPSDASCLAMTDPLGALSNDKPLGRTAPSATELTLLGGVPVDGDAPPVRAEAVLPVRAPCARLRRLWAWMRSTRFASPGMGSDSRKAPLARCLDGRAPRKCRLSPSASRSVWSARNSEGGGLASDELAVRVVSAMAGLSKLELARASSSAGKFAARRARGYAEGLASRSFIAVPCAPSRVQGARDHRKMPVDEVCSMEIDISCQVGVGDGPEEPG